MNKPKLPANPSKDTPAQREARLEYLRHNIREGHTVDAACKLAGTTSKSYYIWINEDPALMAAHEETQMALHNKIGEVAKLCALKALHDHRYQSSMIFYLKCKAGWNDGSGFVTGAQEMPSIQFKQPRKVQKVDKKTDVSN